MVSESTMHVIWAIGLAPFVGSFLGVLVKRLPRGDSVALSRSRAPCCGHVLGWRDLVPVLSWVALRRRCRFCRAPISPFYPAIEVAATAAVAWGASVVSGWVIWPTAVLAWVLLALAVIDVEQGILPDVLTLPLIAAGLVAAWLIAPANIAHHLAGAAAGYVVFEAVRHVYRRVRGREGLGQGDSKLLAASGAWVAATGLPSVVLCASASALIWALIRRAEGKDVSSGTALPFGPFLALGTWVVWLYGPLVIGTP